MPLQVTASGCFYPN